MHITDMRLLSVQFPQQRHNYWASFPRREDAARWGSVRSMQTKQLIIAATIALALTVTYVVVAGAA
jgi:hypothetical protein